MAPIKLILIFFVLCFFLSSLFLYIFIVCLFNGDFSNPLWSKYR